MIGQIRGIVEEVYDNSILVDVSGVGYIVHCSNATINRLPIGEKAVLKIETHVREDHFHLYGFLTLDEKSVFNHLTAISGVGPRLALSILSSMDVKALSDAILLQDVIPFKKVSGVGPRLAQRIITELKGKVDFAGMTIPGDTHGDPSDSANIQDACSALVNLGIVKSEAMRLVGQVYSKYGSVPVEEAIKLALQSRG